MKEEYERLELEVIEFDDDKDVITDSTMGTGPGPNEMPIYTPIGNNP